MASSSTAPDTPDGLNSTATTASPIAPIENGTFDVYARPFVPDFLRAINRMPPLQIYPLLRSTFDIDFDSYIRSFSGTDFIQTPPPEVPNVLIDSLSPTSALEAKTYRNYNFAWLGMELAALRNTQAEFDLYKVPVLFRQMVSPGEMTLSATFEVPGLSENSPYVLVGDVIHIKPLTLDRTGAPLGSFQGQYQQYGAYVSSAMYLPGWSGDMFHGEVTAVKRNTETLDIKLVFPHELYSAIYPRVTASIYNVQFPPREAVQAALWKAVQTASKYLGPQTSTSYASALTNVTQKPAPPSWLQKMLFPEESFSQQQVKLNSIHFRFDPVDKLLNHEQLRAVDSVVAQNYGTVPFVIHGPPGTGKTKTIVEVVLQLLSQGKAKHILVCAPSDPAADTLAERLKSSLGLREMLRLNAPSRTLAEVPDKLMSYCYTKDGTFSIRPFRDMMGFKVVVTTCRDADLLIQARLTNQAIFELEHGLLSALHGDDVSAPEPHWQALLIDEAAQATEPEALIPLTAVAMSSVTTAVKQPIFVMAGDQQQLGPRTACREPVIRTSLFERLLKRQLYASHPLARHRLKTGILAARSLTKSMLPIIRPPFSNLLRNYRSHPAILAVPNALFYHDTLIPEALDTNSLLSWEGWTGAWPVLFAHHLGQDEIETDGGGWYNMEEIAKALEYAISLLRSKLVRQDDICIMSPFSAQVRRLRKQFRALNLYDVNIGPMEAFQGLESRAVILCTTRSRTRFLDQDQARDFGIINEHKRFNVALTRAKHGLIVIGNHDVLAVDPCWRAFLHFCVRNNLYNGQIDEEVTTVASKAPSTTLERMLKQSEARPEATILGLTGELDDPMWIQGAVGPSDNELEELTDDDGSGEDHDEDDEDDVHLI